jgi:hypothetical protein
MSAHADDLRYWYSEDLGRTTELASGSGASATLSDPLEPGRYMLRVVAWGAATDVWVRQGDENVAATASAPSTRFVAPTDPGLSNQPLAFFMVRPGNERTHIAAWGVGAAVTLQLTKISRDKQ